MQIGLAIFMALVAAGYWQVWRRSPRYSAKASWLAAAALILTLAAVVGVTLWLVPSLAPAAGWLAVPLLIGFIILAVLALSAFVVRVTDGPMAKVPKSAVLIDWHRRKFYRIAKVIGIALAAVFAAVDLCPPARPAGMIVAGLLAACAVPALWGLHHKALRNDRAVSALLDHPWVHWHFAGGESWLGHDGLLINDDYTPWALSGTYLVGARVRTDPPARIEFRFVYGTRGTDVLKSVPLPGDAGRDLPFLQQQLRGICPRAEIAVA